MKLILVMLASNATRERLFSVLKRFKTYRSSMMTLCHMNNLIVLHVYKDELDMLDLKTIGTEFIGASDHRRPVLGHF